MKKLILSGFIFMYSVTIVLSQSYENGKFNIETKYFDNKSYTLYIFSREKNTVKAKYFSTNADKQFEDWRSNKRILLVTAGAYSSGWDVGSSPVGLNVDNGKIVTRNPKPWDGLIVIYNGGTQKGGIGVTDLDINPITCTDYNGVYNYNPRDNVTDCYNFLNWGANNGLTIFQTHLVYSEKKMLRDQFSTNGSSKIAERRYLVICSKNGTVHHIVVDAPDAQTLNIGGRNVYNILNSEGFQVLYILNLDTGGKNFLQINKGNGLVEGLRGNNTSIDIKSLTNMLVYYTEDD